MVPAEDADNILSTGPSFAHGGRYNKAGEFGALYVGEDPEICLKEKLKQVAGQPQFLPPQVIGEVEVDVAQALDLTDDDNLTALGISQDDLVDALDVTLTRKLAETARDMEIHALLVPSAAAPGKNLVIFENSLFDPRCKVRVIRTRAWSAE